jgi:oxygen-independent coproporphyrinogen-3 oxidase
MYEYTMDYLPKKGFRHYETSNFAKEGYSCRHNMHYWNNGTSIGLGPAAFSYSNRRRSQNIVDTEKYIEKIKAGKSPVVFKEWLPPLKSAAELAVLKLRTKEGIDFEKFKKSTGFELRIIKKRSLQKLIAEGLLRYKRKNKEIVGIALTKKGFLFSDTVSAELL